MKTYQEFLDLHDNLAAEVLLVPGFPRFSSTSSFFDPRALGEALGSYLTRMHHSLAARGVFSPRLMHFCMVDVHRVHIEEELRVTKLLGDNQVKGSFWQVVDEKWLVKWRRFVSGRGARRYLPPCAISNNTLMLWERTDTKGRVVKRDSPVADMDWEKKLELKREYEEGFKLMVDDQDGTITTVAMGMVMRALGRNPTEAELSDLINQVDADGNGTVTFEEFDSLMGKFRVSAGRDWDDLVHCFRLFDKENSGTFNFDEFRHALLNEGETLSEKEFTALGLGNKVEKDGQVNYEDLIKGLSSKETNSGASSSRPSNVNSDGKPVYDGDSSWRQVPRTHLNLVEHYRVVNFNVWNYWLAVHGGGPAITRKGREIYSEPAKSKLQAVLQLQCWARQNVAASRLDTAFLKNFTQTAKGCRQALCGHLIKKVVREGEEQVRSYLRRDNEKRLTKHANFAQRVWKRKKGISSMDKTLSRLKAEQTIFSKSTGEIEQAAEGQPLVVEEHTPVILIGSAEEYEILLSEDRGLEFMKRVKLRKHSACEMTYIANVPEGFDARQRDGTRNDQFGDRGAGGFLKDGVHHNSVLLSVNNYPVNSLTFRETIDRLTSTRWPLLLRWRRPLELTECFSLIEIATNIHGDPLPREETEWRRGGDGRQTLTENQEEQNKRMLVK